MVNLILIDYKKNNWLILSYILILLSLFLYHFRVRIFDDVVFFPVILMLSFIIIYFLNYVDDFRNLYIKKNNLIYLILFFIYLIINLLCFNKEFNFTDNSNIFYKLYLKDLIKYFSYYFFFCIIGPIIIAKNKLIFFKLLLTFTIILISFGMFMIIYYNFVGHDLIQRLFYYKDASVVGARFYSLFGEPRDATVALVTIISMIIILFKNFDKKIKLKYINYVFITAILSIIALFSTKSATLLLIIIFSSLIILIFIIFLKVSRQQLIILFMTITLFSFFSFLAIYFFPRLNGYFLEFINLTKFLFNNTNSLDMSIINNNFANTRLIAQIKDVYPILKYLEGVRDFEYLKILFGNGTYASFTLNTNDFIQPHSNLSRFLYDNGIVGIGLLTLFFYSTLTFKKNFYDIVLLSLVFSGFLALNSMFIFGFLLVNLSNNLNKEY